MENPNLRSQNVKFWTRRGKVGKTNVKILNFANGMYDYDEWLDEIAELI